MYVQLETLSLVVLQVRLCRAQQTQQQDPAVLGGEEHHAVRGQLDHAGGQGKDPLTCRPWEAGTISISVFKFKYQICICSDVYKVEQPAHKSHLAALSFFNFTLPSHARHPTPLPEVAS